MPKGSPNQRQPIEYHLFRDSGQDNDTGFQHSNGRRVCWSRLGQHMYHHWAEHACQSKRDLPFWGDWRHSEYSYCHHNYSTWFQNIRTF